MSLEGAKVITATQTRFVEEFAISKGASALGFMEKAAEGVALFVEKIAGESRQVTLLVGKGNNAGDALCAGAHLLSKGFEIKAYYVQDPAVGSPLCQEMHQRFVAAGGTLQKFNFRKGFFHGYKGIFLDGLLGTGFQGRVEEPFASLIKEVNQASGCTVAIDVPSGLNANTGDVETVAIVAHYTLCLGPAKVGFFRQHGLDYTGVIEYLDFGLSSDVIEMATSSAYLLDETTIGSYLPKIEKTRHKYQAGYVLAVASSLGMKGAGVMASHAALKAGAGMVRLFHRPGLEAQLGAIPEEILSQPFDPSEMKPLVLAQQKAKALLIGPGLGRDVWAEKVVKKVLKTTKLPCVIDADALYFLRKPPAGSILTPHRGEAARLIPRGAKDEVQALQEYVDTHQVTVILKGAPTWIFHPGCVPLISLRGDPGMATAGSGDVLTGIVAALVAQGMLQREAAALAVYLHGLAGEMAAEELTSYCVTATDLIRYLPSAFKATLS